MLVRKSESALGVAVKPSGFFGLVLEYPPPRVLLQQKTTDKDN